MAFSHTHCWNAQAGNPALSSLQLSDGKYLYTFGPCACASDDSTSANSADDPSARHGYAKLPEAAQDAALKRIRDGRKTEAKDPASNQAARPRRSHHKRFANRSVRYCAICEKASRHDSGGAQKGAVTTEEETLIRSLERLTFPAGK